MRNAEEKLQIMATSHQIELQKIQEENDKNLVQVYYPLSAVVLSLF